MKRTESGLLIPEPFEYLRGMRGVFGNVFGAPFAKPFSGVVGGGNPLASVPWVAQWKFNNNGNDSIGANTLTNNGSATFTTGKLGGATGATQLVAASTQYWSIADNAALSMGDLDFTICSWVYCDSLPTMVCVDKAKTSIADSYDHEYQLAVVSSKARFLVGNGIATYLTISADTFGVLSTGIWHCVIAWHDSVANTINIQVNNGAIDSAAYSSGSFNSNGNFSIGANAVSYSPGAYFNGRVDNVCIAKSAPGGGGVLSAAQRMAFYNAGIGTEVLT